MSKYGVDVYRVMVKPAFVGLALNVLVPAGLVALGYYLQEEGRVTEGSDGERQLVFMVVAAMCATVAAVAFYLRTKLWSVPIICTRETFVQDFTSATMGGCILLSAVTEFIAILGFVHFLLGGSLNELMLFAVLSVVVYQLIRPRAGFLEAAVERQERFVDEEKFSPMRERRLAHLKRDRERHISPPSQSDDPVE